MLRSISHTILVNISFKIAAVVRDIPSQVGAAMVLLANDLELAVSDMYTYSFQKHITTNLFIK